MRILKDMLSEYQSNRAFNRAAKEIEKMCIEHPEEFSPEEKQRNWEDMCRRIAEHERRMKTDPAYVREMKKRGRREDIYMFFHRGTANKPSVLEREGEKKPTPD